MKRLAQTLVGVTGLVSLSSTAAFAASDVSNSPAQANQVVVSVAAPIASAQTSSLISGAIAGGFVPSGGIGGGFTPSGGTGGGFAPSGGGGTGGGFAPSGGGGGVPDKNSFNVPTDGGISEKGNIQSSRLASTRQMGRAGGDSSTGLGIWTQATGSHIRKTEEYLRMSGNVYNAVAGVDYRFSDVVTGLALSYEKTNLKTAFNSGTFDGNGVSVAPYIGVSLSQSWVWDLSAGYGWLNYETSRNSGAATSDYSAERFFAASNVTGSFAYDKWRFQPRIGTVYSRERSDSYTESTGSIVGASVTASGKAVAGSKIGYSLENSVPYIKVLGEWDYLTPDAVLKSNGEMSSVSRYGGVFGVGYEYYWQNMMASAELNYNSVLREDLDVITAAFRVRWDF